MTDPTTTPLLTDAQLNEMLSEAFYNLTHGVNDDADLAYGRAIESAVRAPLLAEIERERQSRLAAQVRVEQLHAEVARLEPMRQRAADIERLARERDEARAELHSMLNPNDEMVGAFAREWWLFPGNGISIRSCLAAMFAARKEPTNG